MGAIKLDPASIKNGVKKVLKKLFEPKSEAQPQLVLQPVKPRPKYYR